MIDVGSQHQSVVFREPLRIRRFAPRFDVTCNQVVRIIDAGYPAARFDAKHIIAKDSLPSARKNERLLFSQRQIALA